MVLQEQNSFLVMREYEDVMDTMLPWQSDFVVFVPSVYDLVNAFPNWPAEVSLLAIQQVVMDEHLFVRWLGEYLNQPIKEVW